MVLDFDAIAYTNCKNHKSTQASFRVGSKGFEAKRGKLRES
jgi:hypothetical protein